MTAHATVLPFSTSGGISSLTRPVLSLASPMTSAIAASIAAGVARAGRTARPASAPPMAAAPASCKTSRRVLAGSPAPARRLRLTILPMLASLLQRRQKRHHILDLLRRQYRLAPEGGGNALKTVDPIVGRHDGVRVDAGGIDDAQAQLR